MSSDYRPNSDFNKQADQRQLRVAVESFVGTLPAEAKRMLSAKKPFRITYRDIEILITRRD